ncbi:MAG TPA: hypothetical protein VMB35_00440 [Methanomicrobiales archaeon]|nr:hypothetical protein [Methanomicrobiales archaeon]
MSRNIIATAILGLVIVAALALPASAAQADGNAAGKAAVDPQLKADLWANHHQYRLAHFDLNVQRANSIIGILDKYGIDTTQPQATLATISGERGALDTALTNQDRDALKTINQQLLSQWKQFAQEVKQSIRDHYRGAKAATTTTAADAGLTDDSQALSL